MNFSLTHPLPERCVVAVSGGIDSLSVLHFLRRVEGRVASVIHVNHASGDFAEEAEVLVRDLCDREKIDLTVRRVMDHRGEGESREAFWREQRYRFFWDEAVVRQENLPIVLAHNLDDCLEEYIICTMIRGYSGTIPYKHGCCIRPFRMWERKDIVKYAKRHDINFLHDPSNDDDTRFLRAKIRRRVTPRIRNLNPGICSIVKKVIQQQDERDGNPLQPEKVSFGDRDSYLLLAASKEET